MDLKRLTGLSTGQLAVLTGMVREHTGDVAKPGGRPPCIDLFHSVALVVMLMRGNVPQDFAGGVSGVSQATVSRRWDLIRPASAWCSPGSSPARVRSSGPERAWWMA